VLHDNPEANEVIYQNYLKAFKKGVYNYIKDDYDRYAQQTIPRKYFSGGFLLTPAMVTTVNANNLRVLTPSMFENLLSLINGYIESAKFTLHTFKEELKDTLRFRMPKSFKMALLSIVMAFNLTGPVLASSVGTNIPEPVPIVRRIDRQVGPVLVQPASGGVVQVQNLQVQGAQVHQNQRILLGKNNFQQGGYVYHIVQSRETLTSIARDNGITLERIFALNLVGRSVDLNPEKPISPIVRNPHWIVPNQKIVIGMVDGVSESSRTARAARVAPRPQIVRSTQVVEGSTRPAVPGPVPSVARPAVQEAPTPVPPVERPVPVVTVASTPLPVSSPISSADGQSSTTTQTVTDVRLINATIKNYPYISDGIQFGYQFMDTNGVHLGTLMFNENSNNFSFYSPLTGQVIGWQKMTNISQAQQDALMAKMMASIKAVYLRYGLTEQTMPLKALNSLQQSLSFFIQGKGIDGRGWSGHFQQAYGADSFLHETMISSGAGVWGFQRGSNGITGPHRHAGEDRVPAIWSKILRINGKPVFRALGKMRVRNVAHAYAYGYYVDLLESDGRHYIRVTHMYPNEIFVHKGQELEPGQTVGLMGGNEAPGEFAHFHTERRDVNGPEFGFAGTSPISQVTQTTAPWLFARLPERMPRTVSLAEFQRVFHLGSNGSPRVAMPAVSSPMAEPSPIPASPNFEQPLQQGPMVLPSPPTEHPMSIAVRETQLSRGSAVTLRTDRGFVLSPRPGATVDMPQGAVLPDTSRQTSSINISNIQIQSDGRFDARVQIGSHISTSFGVLGGPGALTDSNLPYLGTLKLSPYGTLEYDNDRPTGSVRAAVGTSTLNTSTLNLPGSVQLQSVTGAVPSTSGFSVPVYAGSVYGDKIGYVRIDRTTAAALFAQGNAWIIGGGPALGGNVEASVGAVLAHQFSSSRLTFALVMNAQWNPQVSFPGNSGGVMTGPFHLALRHDFLNGSGPSMGYSLLYTKNPGISNELAIQIFSQWKRLSLQAGVTRTTPDNNAFMNTETRVGMGGRYSLSPDATLTGGVYRDISRPASGGPSFTRTGGELGLQIRFGHSGPSSFEAATRAVHPLANFDIGQANITANQITDNGNIVRLVTDSAYRDSVLANNRSDPNALFAQSINDLINRSGHDDHAFDRFIAGLQQMRLNDQDKLKVLAIMSGIAGQYNYRFATTPGDGHAVNNNQVFLAGQNALNTHSSVPSVICVQAAYYIQTIASELGLTAMGASVTVLANAHGLTEGHAVTIVRASDGYLYIVEWGRVLPTRTKDFLTAMELDQAIQGIPGLYYEITNQQGRVIGRMLSPEGRELLRGLTVLRGNEHGYSIALERATKQLWGMIGEGQEAVETYNDPNSAIQGDREHNRGWPSVNLEGLNQQWHQIVDHSMLNPGGIDFTASKFDLEIKRDRYGVPLPFRFQDLARLKSIDGFVPVLINIITIKTLPFLAELKNKFPRLFLQSEQAYA
ncbi:MAG: LysM peptidoglycan-binding domain-containing protein, partial [Candidatus Omnitrophica bacterium]|nr:LysM peptidoglycan-binding domain-containing protein [Candidatus Omnitrophota bacterium]